MRIAIIADVHLRPSDLSVGAEVFVSACRSAQANHADILIIAGDLFDSSMVGGRGASTGSVVAVAKSALAQFKGSKYLLLGNHELAGVGQQHALEVLRGLPGVEIIDRDCVLGNVECSIAFLPYISPAHLFSKSNLSREQLREKFAQAIDSVLANFREQKPVLLVGHCAICGGVANKSGYRIIGNGDSMELTAGQLESVGARYIAWGDFHRRQSFWNDNNGYIGALRQLNHGEECNPTGYRLIDTDTGEDVFIEIESPMYYTVTTDEYSERRLEMDSLAAAGHIIKVRGSQLPTDGILPIELPAGVKFEKLPPDTIVQRRSEQEFVADESPAALLEKWHSHTASGVEFAELSNKFGQLAEGVEFRTTGIGSLVRILSIELVNIAKHSNTRVDLSDMTGIICIDGDNGAGKTTLLESLLLALYGVAPSYGCDLYQMVTQGQVGDAAVRVTFEADGDTYQVERTAHITAKTKSQDCTVYRLDGGQRVPVAGGPKRQSEADEFIAKLVGDRELLLSSVFAAQKAADLVDFVPAERKDLLSKLLGSERFEPIAEKARAEMKRLKAEAERYRAKAEALRETAGNVDDLALRLKDANARQEAARYNLEQAARALDEARQKLAEAKADTSIALAERELREARERLVAAANVLDGLNAKAARRMTLKAQLATAKAQVESFGDIHRELALERQAVEKAERANLIVQQKRDQINAQIQSLQEEQQTHTAAYFKAFSAWQKELDAAVRARDDKRNRLVNELARLDQDLKTAQKKAELLSSPDIGCKGELPCVFLKDAKAAKATIEDIEVQLMDVTQDLDYYDEWPEVASCAQIKAREPQSQPDDTAERIAELKASMPSNAPVDRSAVRELESKLQKLTEAEKAVSVIEGQLEQYSTLTTDIAEATTQKETAQKAVQTAQKRFDDLKAKSPIEEFERALRAAVAHHSETQSAYDSVTSTAATLNATMELAKKNLAAAEAHAAQANEHEAAMKVHEVLAAAFGRDGIPQLILDTAIPRLAELSQMLLQASGFEGSLVFRTQGVTQSGKIREVLDILAWDAETGDYRDVSQFSGGEGTILRLAIRLAFGLLQAERSGRRIQVVVADESFQALKPERALAALSMFEVLAERFTQIFVISHHTEVTSAIPQTIYVRKVDGRSTVEVVNG